MVIKQIKVLIVSLVTVFFIGTTFAADFPVQAKMRCVSREGTIDRPIRNGMVLVTTTTGEMYLPTDSEGVFLLDEQYADKPLFIYLAASAGAMYPYCHSPRAAGSHEVTFSTDRTSVCPTSMYCKIRN